MKKLYRKEPFNNIVLVIIGVAFFAAVGIVIVKFTAQQTSTKHFSEESTAPYEQKDNEQKQEEVSGASIPDGGRKIVEALQFADLPEPKTPNAVISDASITAEEEPAAVDFSKRVRGARDVSDEYTQVYVGALNLDAVCYREHEGERLSGKYTYDKQTNGDMQLLALINMSNNIICDEYNHDDDLLTFRDVVFTSIAFENIKGERFVVTNDIPQTFAIAHQLRLPAGWYERAIVTYELPDESDLKRKFPHILRPYLTQPVSAVVEGRFRLRPASSMGFVYVVDTKHHYSEKTSEPKVVPLPPRWIDNAVVFADVQASRGGTLAHPKGLQLDLPANALPEDMIISIERGFLYPIPLIVPKELQQEFLIIRPDAKLKRSGYLTMSYRERMDAIQEAIKNGAGSEERIVQYMIGSSSPEMVSPEHINVDTEQKTARVMIDRL